MKRHSEAILIVDDEKLVRRLLVTTLSGEGYTCLKRVMPKKHWHNFKIIR